MTDDEIMAELRAAGALLEGHFILTSGLRSPRYVQIARLFMQASRAEKLAKRLAERVAALVALDNIDLIVTPALGGIIPAYEVGRQMGKPVVYLERAGDVLELRRGFDIPEHARCLIVDGVVTTGLSIRETADTIVSHSAAPIAACAFVDRSGGSADVRGLPFVALLQLTVPTYKADNLPPELAALPAVRPGSRRP
jgi:orotate phosphoribosyltransferase